MPGVEQGLLPAAFGLSSPVSRRQRGLQTGLRQLQRRLGRKRSQGESGTGGSDRAAPLACRVLCRIPGEGTEASPFEKEEKIIISKPRNPELLGAYLSR